MPARASVCDRKEQEGEDAKPMADQGWLAASVAAARLKGRIEAALSRPQSSLSGRKVGGRVRRASGRMLADISLTASRAEAARSMSSPLM